MTLGIEHLEPARSTVHGLARRRIRRGPAGDGESHRHAEMVQVLRHVGSPLTQARSVPVRADGPLGHAPHDPEIPVEDQGFGHDPPADVLIVEGDAIDSDEKVNQYEA